MSVTIQLVTGILGSGKTSLLRHLVSGQHLGPPTAVVVGEFAEQGFDADLLEETGAHIVQLAGTGLGQAARSYLPAVRELVRGGRVGRVFVETSGVAEIRKIGAELREDPEVREGATFGQTMVVMDAGAFEAHDKWFGDQLWAQLDVADIVVVNKTDRADAEATRIIRRRVAEAVPHARVMYSYMGQVPRHEALSVPHEGFEARILSAPDAPTSLAEFESFVYRTDAVCFDMVTFGHQLLNLPGARIARFKGKLRLWDGTRALNGLPGQLDWENLQVKGPTSIAFIGLELDDHADAIRQQLDAELARQLEDMRRG